MTIKIRRSRSVDYDDDDDQNECAVSGWLYVILRVSQIVGVAPVSFRNLNNGWAMRASGKMGVATYIFTTALALSFLGGIVLMESMQKKVNVHTLPLTEVVLGIGCNLLTMIVPSLMGYTSLGRLRTIVSGLSKIQKATEIKKSIFKPSRNGIVFIAIYFISTWVMVFINKWFLYTHGFLGKGLLQHGITDVNRTRAVLTLLQFVFVTLEIKLLLQLVNDQLSQLLIEKKAKKVKQKPTKEIISSLFSTYDTICKVVDEMNDGFGFIIMTVLWVSCWGLVLYPYCFTQSPIPDLTTGIILVFFVSESANYAVWLFMVVEPSHRLNCEISRTSHLVRLLSMQRRLDFTSAQLQQFHLYLLICRTSFKPMHVCTLDRPLIATLGGFVITYLVICIQLKQLGESH